MHLAVENLTSKRPNGTIIFKDISFDIRTDGRKGHVLAIRGPSGKIKK